MASITTFPPVSGVNTGTAYDDTAIAARVKGLEDAGFITADDLPEISEAEWSGISGNIADQEDLATALNAKQDTLVSGTNIKTINGETVLGEGDIIIQSGGLDEAQLEAFLIGLEDGTLSGDEYVVMVNREQDVVTRYSLNDLIGTIVSLVDEAGGDSGLDFEDRQKIDSIAFEATKNETDGYLLDRANHTGTQPASTVDGLDAALDTKIDKVEGKGLSDSNYTQAEKDKLSSLEGSKFVGLFVNESALPTAGGDGDYANVDGGAGNDVYRVIWDSTNSKWVAMLGVSTELTPAQIKQQYESNPDTNVFTDDEKTKLTGIATEATKNRADSLNADKVHIHTWDQVTGKPTSYPTKWDDVSNKPIVQTVGTSTTDLMSQKAVTEAIANIPSVSKSSAYTVVAEDKGKSIDTTSDVTIPASVFTVGDVLVVTNMSASNISITPASGVTFRLAGTGSTGLRTLSGYGVATLRMASNNVWFMSMAGDGGGGGGGIIEEGVLYLMSNGVTMAAKPSVAKGKWHSFMGKDYYVAIDYDDLVSVVSVYKNLIGDGEILANLTRDGQTKSIPLNQVVTTFVEQFGTNEVTGGLFYNAQSFNQRIDSWDVSNVTNMDRMFLYCYAFNQNIGSWNVGNVTNMHVLFYDCHAFNQDIGDWDTSNVTNMNHMFQSCSVFVQDLSDWCVSRLSSKPSSFDTNTSAAWTTAMKPKWGAPC